VAAERKIRVMLVEDEDLYRDLLRTVLAQMPRLEVVGAFADGSTALAEGPSLRPDAAMLDIQLPGGLDGIHLGLALRRELPDLGIVMLSNYADIRFVAALRQRPLYGWSYLLKQSVRDVRALLRALEGAVVGDVVLDPSLVAGMRPREGGQLDRLTRRQQDILALLAQGLTNAGIAEHLVLAEKSVENLLTDIYEVFGIDSRQHGVHARVKAVLLYLQETRFVSSTGCAQPRRAST
jgi:DNA-binding NarL/FixJ family response regulator